MLYAVGGRENSSDALGHSAYVNAYDPVTSTWHSRADLLQTFRPWRSFCQNEFGLCRTL
jgi:hypothetical protein